MIYDLHTIKEFRKTNEHKFKENPSSFAFSMTGDNLAVSFSNDIQIFDPLTSKFFTKINLENKNVEFFTKNTILCSNKNMVSYVSLHDSTILKCFEHNSEVRNISVSDSDLFMTTSDYIHIFDIKSQQAAFKVELKNATGTFLQGNIFIVANNSLIYFYDTRNIKGPIKTVNMINTTKLKYNYLARKIIIENKTDKTHAICDENLNVLHKLIFAKNCQADLTPDGRYYFTSEPGIIKAYDISNKNQVHNIRDMELKGGSIAFNPAYGQMITGNNNLRFWVPDI